MPYAPARRRFGLAARLTILLGIVTGLGVLAMWLYVSRALEAQAVARLQSTMVTQAGVLHDSFAPLLDGPPGEPGSRRAPSVTLGSSEPG